METAIEMKGAANLLLSPGLCNPSMVQSLLLTMSRLGLQSLWLTMSRLGLQSLWLTVSRLGLQSLLFTMSRLGLQSPWILM